MSSLAAIAVASAVWAVIGYLAGRRGERRRKAALRDLNASASLQAGRQGLSVLEGGRRRQGWG